MYKTPGAKSEGIFKNRIGLAGAGVNGENDFIWPTGLAEKTSKPETIEIFLQYC